jgi:hypothetical protein
MPKPVKNIYRILAWIFTALIASGTLLGCRGPVSKYGPPTPAAKYGPPTVSDYKDVNNRT